MWWAVFWVVFINFVILTSIGFLYGFYKIWVNVKSVREKADIVIPFDNFVKYYELMPEKYHIYQNLNKSFTVIYHTMSCLNGVPCSKEYKIGFSFRDYIQLLHFVKQLDNKKENEIKTEAMKGYLESVSKDLENFKKDNGFP